MNQREKILAALFGLVILFWWGKPVYDRWFVEHMFMFAPAVAGVARWLQSFREFPPRQKAASFSLDKAMEKLSTPGPN